MINDLDETSVPEPTAVEEALLDGPNTAAERNHPSRRAVLKGFGAAGVAATLPPVSAAEVRGTATREPASATGAASELVRLALKVNGKKQEAQVDPRASLLDALRETMHLTGTKKGCDHGQCGACTVHIDGKRVLSCLSLALTCQGQEITTIEGLGTPERMHRMQAAFVECDGFQCGYCTAGQIMSAVALLKEPIGPEDADVREAMSGNICRCGAYGNIVEAIQQVRRG